MLAGYREINGPATGADFKAARDLPRNSADRSSAMREHADARAFAEDQRETVFSDPYRSRNCCARPVRMGKGNPSRNLLMRIEVEIGAVPVPRYLGGRGRVCENQSAEQHDVGSDQVLKRVVVTTIPFGLHHRLRAVLIFGRDRLRSSAPLTGGAVQGRG